MFNGNVHSCSSKFSRWFWHWTSSSWAVREMLLIERRLFIFIFSRRSWKELRDTCALKWMNMTLKTIFFFKNKSRSRYLSLKKERKWLVSFPKIDELVMDFVDKRPVFIPAVQFWRRRREGAKSADEKSPSNWRWNGQSNRQSITAPGTCSSSAISSDSSTCYT